MLARDSQQVVKGHARTKEPELHLLGKFMSEIPGVFHQCITNGSVPHLIKLVLGKAQLGLHVGLEPFLRSGITLFAHNKLSIPNQHLSQPSLCKNLDVALHPSLVVPLLLLVELDYGTFFILRCHGAGGNGGGTISCLRTAGIC